MLKKLRDRSKNILLAATKQDEDGPLKAPTVASGPSSPKSPGSLPNGTPRHAGDAYSRDTAEFGEAVRASLEEGTPAEPGRSTLPDFMRDPSAVLEDEVPWRHGNPPDYSTVHSKYLRERTNIWPPGSLEDLVTNLIKNWKKETSHKARLEDLRTINAQAYRFGCNGGRSFTAEEMMEVGTSNALIQEAAFYSARNTSFDDSHQIFREAMPGGFCWEVTEVYSGPPVMAFKWRHWGQMTGKLVCPVGSETTLEAEPTEQEVEVWGVCIAHTDPDFRISKLEVFYDPHELMAGMVDANNLSYKVPDEKAELNQTERSFRAPTDGSIADDEFTTSRGSMNEEDDMEVMRSLMAGNGHALSKPSGSATSQTLYTNGSIFGSSGASKAVHKSAAAEDTARAPKAPEHERLFASRQSSLSTQQSLPQLKGSKLEADIAYESPHAGAAKLGERPQQGAEALSYELPSDAALLSALVDPIHNRPRAQGSNCPVPHT